MVARDGLDLSRAAWRKSTHSNAGGECVEVAAVSSPLGRQDGDDRVHAVRPGRVVAVRDSADPVGPTLVFDADAWRTFAARLAGGVVRVQG